MTEDSHARQPAGQGADKIQRVDLDAIAADTLDEVPASWAIEHELKGFAMDIGPLGHNVCDKAAIVSGRELHRALECHVDIDPVSPDSLVNPTSKRYLRGAHPIGGPNGRGR